MSDIKIRFSSANAETWTPFFIHNVLSHDWESQPVGVHHFKCVDAFKVAGDEKDKVAQLALYRTKTLRVAYISCIEPNLNHK